MPSPFSPTGEDYAEISITGAKPIAKAVAKSLKEANVVEARRGEFSRRALEAGKISAFEITEIAKVFKVASFTEAQEFIREITKAIIAAEVRSDRVSTNDRKPLVNMKCRKVFNRTTLQNKTVKHVFIVGNPNAGKSSLFNAITTGKNSMVSSSIRTTRNVLAARLGNITICDTPGFESGVSGVNAKATAEAALRSRIASVLVIVAEKLDAFYRSSASCAVVRVRPKIDLVHKLSKNSFDFEVSAYSLEGVSSLRQNLRLLSSKVQTPPITEIIRSSNRNTKNELDLL